jgi:CBS domain-containing protein
MKVFDGVRRSGVGIEPDRTMAEAAGIMEHTGVGALVVIDGDRPIGIVTDRDIVRRGVARRLPPDARIDAVMSAPVVTIDADADLHDAYALFRSNALRRLAVVRGGAFVGMLTVDDLLIDLAADLADLSRPVMGEALFGHHESELPVSS